MSDAIALTGIRAWGRHGADPGEQDVPQPIDVDVRLELDLSAAARSDALEDTLDYAALHRTVLRIVATERCALLERLGDALLDALMADPRVLGGRIVLAKPGLLGGATPSVTLERRRAR